MTMKDDAVWLKANGQGEKSVSYLAITAKAEHTQVIADSLQFSEKLEETEEAQEGSLCAIILLAFH